MPQIAQQDYIRIQVADLDYTTEFTAEEKNAILKHIANWPDILLEDSKGVKARILARQSTAIFYFDVENGEVAKLELNA